MARLKKNFQWISSRRLLAAGSLASLLSLLLFSMLGVSKAEDSKAGKQASETGKHIIGATAELVEAESGFAFKARVDTGAKSCSLHVEQWEIKDAAKFKSEKRTMKANIGKQIRFRLVNEKGETQWVEKKIVGYAVYKTSEKKERRYQVLLDMSYNGYRKLVKVNLNDRSHMEFPLLLGRNYLRGDFLVDVDLNNDEKPPIAVEKKGDGEEESDVEEESDDEQEVAEEGS